MRIKEFADFYRVDRRSIDYWTNIGLIHPRILENGYRDYNDRCDDEIIDILIALGLDRPEPLENVVEMIRMIDNEDDWADIIDELGGNRYNAMRKYDVAITSAKRRLEGK